MRQFLWVLFVLCSCATPGAKAPPPDDDVLDDATLPKKKPNLTPPKLRLPQHIAPKAYRVRFRIVPGEPQFSGSAELDIEVKKPARVVWLHGKDLKLESASDASNGFTEQLEVKNPSEDWLALVAKEPMTVGLHTLSLKWSAPLSSKERTGIFQREEDGLPYVFTDFEPMDARRALPCFDEPSFKVPWQLTLEVKAEHAAFSNMPVEKESPLENGFKAVQFKATPPMPSYLLAFAVGALERLDGGRIGKALTPFGIVTTKGKLSQTTHALSNTGPLLDALEAFVDAPYPYEKLDLLALPFSYGAMEHPGLITYGQRLLLSAPGEDTLQRQRDFAAYTAHELAHMWFGNQVTLNFWDDVWLNESFAEWAMFRALETVHPRWQIGVDRVGTLSAALEADALGSARAVRQPIENRDDIESAFDDITYLKGSSVLRAFEVWMGPEIFQRGVRAYLKKHAWGVTKSEDFFAALSAEAGKDVVGPLRTFLDGPGAPRVNVELKCSKGGPSSVSLSQKRYLPFGSQAAASPPAPTVWRIPVCVRWGQGKDTGRACTLLETPQAELKLDAPKCPDWVVPNENGSGYYRSSMPSFASAARNVLMKKEDGATLEERLALAGDLHAAVKAGELEPGELLGLLPLLLAQPEPQLWSVATALAAASEPAWFSGELRAKQQAFMRSTFGSRFLSVGLSTRDKDDEATKLSRPALMLAMRSDPKVRAQAVRQVREWLKDPKAIEPELLGAVMGIAGEANDAKLHGEVLAALKQEPDAKQRARLLRFLTAATAPARVEQNLSLLTDAAVELSEVRTLLNFAFAEPATQTLALQTLETKFDLLKERLPSSAWPWLFGNARQVCDAEVRTKLNLLLAPRAAAIPGAGRELTEMLERIDLCVARKAKQQAGLEAFLKQKH